MQNTILQEQLKRELASRKGDVADVKSVLCPEQLAYIEDPARLVIARCGRRGGKSFANAVDFIDTCIRYPSSPLLYVGLTRESVKEMVWSIFIDLLHDFRIPHRAFVSSLKIEFPNKSFIQLFGADTDRAKARLRGRKWKKVVVDESAYVQAVDSLIYDVLLASTADYEGQLRISSTPPRIPKGLFYDASVGDQKDIWSEHHWTLRHNPFFRGEKGEKELAFIVKTVFGGNWEHPTFRREYLGEWVFDNTSAIIPLEQGKNLVDHDTAKAAKTGTDFHVIGLDLGLVDPNAVVVLRCSEDSRNTYVVDCWKAADKTVDEIAAVLETLQQKYKASEIIADTGGYGAGIVNELRKRYQLPIKAADKKDKGFYIEILRADTISGYIKILKTLPVVDEIYGISKNPDTGLPLDGSEDHYFHALLYAYRYAYVVHLRSYETPLTEEERMIQQMEHQATVGDTKEYWETLDKDRDFW